VESVREILSAHGYDNVNDLDMNDPVEVDPGGETDMPLTIEKVYEDGDTARVSVAHYYTQRGDLMSDPEVVFDINTDAGDSEGWTPVRYVQHPYIEQYDEDGLGNDVRAFVNEWDSNLRRDGYVNAAHGSERGGDQ